MQVVIMDGISYNIGIEYESLSRSFEIIEGSNSGTNINARSIRDILGTGYTYEMTFLPLPDYISDYDNFYLAISEPKEYHTLAMPFGQSVITFQAKITSGNDTFGGNYSGTNEWRSLKVTFEYMEPYRT